MVEAAPSGARIEAGERLLSEITTGGVPIDAAAWVYDEERERWLLTIVSERFSGGLAHAYDVLSPFVPWAARLDEPEELAAEDVMPVPRDRDLGRALIAMAPLTGSKPRPVNDRYVAGVFIPQAILYPIAA